MHPLGLKKYDQIGKVAATFEKKLLLARKVTFLLLWTAHQVFFQ